MERLTLLSCEAFNRGRHTGAGSIVPVYMDGLQLYKSNWKWPERMHSGYVGASINGLA